VVGMDRTLAEFDVHTRMLVLGTSALEEVLDGLALDPTMEVPIFIGVRDDALDFSKDDAARLATGLTRVAHTRCKATIATVAGGNASGLTALALARQRVEKGSAQLAIAGGVDSHIDPVFLERLDALGRCKSLGNKWGYPPGEGAAMLAVCTTALAKQARIPIFAGLVAEGRSVERSPLGGEGICLGLGLAHAIRSALEPIVWPDETIATQYCDINGEFYRTEEFMYATQRLPGHAFRAIDEYIGPADCWGDVGAASGPLLAVLAVESGRRGYARGNLALLWAGSENGQRAACVLCLPHAQGAGGRSS
jgi:3-oxoacyl-[acyl-carrier-protein] synthase-1